MAVSDPWARAKVNAETKKEGRSLVAVEEAAGSVFILVKDKSLGGGEGGGHKRPGMDRQKSLH